MTETILSIFSLFLQNMFSKLVTFVKGDETVPQVDTHWMSEAGVIDVFFFFGPRPMDVFEQYASLTGTQPIPPVCALKNLAP